MIDEKGYRANVGMVIINGQNKVFWGKRLGQKSWQFPQGGVNEGEAIEDAMFRELYEETGLLAEHVEVVCKTSSWLHYELPKKFRRKTGNPICIGQKQQWFLLRLLVDDDVVDFSKSEKAEFDGFRWVDFWYPIQKVIFFKRHVYRSALSEFSKTLGIRPKERHEYRKSNKRSRQYLRKPRVSK